MMRFDADVARQVEATYLTADVVEQRRGVLQLLALQPAERVLDIGSGPGLLATDIAAVVGPDGRVCGTDISDSMLAIARARGVPDGSAPVEYRNAGADDLPYPEATFDVAVSTQVLEYVPDIPTALAQIHRVLRPGGRVLVLDTDWDSIVWHSRAAGLMRRVLTVWDQHLANPYLPRTLGPALHRAGFTDPSVRVLPLLNVGFDPDTYSAGLIKFIARFVVGRDGLTAADADVWAEDLRTLGSEYFFSLNRYVFCATRPA